MELCLIGWFQNYFQFAFLALLKVGALNPRLMVVLPGVLNFERTGALQLNPVVHGGPPSHAVSSEAGAWIVHFQQTDRAPGAVLDCHFNMGRMTAGEGEAGGEPHS